MWCILKIKVVREGKAAQPRDWDEVGWANLNASVICSLQGFFCIPLHCH